MKFTKAQIAETVIWLTCHISYMISFQTTMLKYVFEAVLSSGLIRFDLFAYFLGQIAKKYQILPLGVTFLNEILL